MFAGLACAALLLLARIVLPFLIPVLLGAFVVVLFDPVHQRLRSLLPSHPRLCAAISATSVLLLLLLPLAVVAVLVAHQLLGMASAAEALLRDGTLHDTVHASLPPSLSVLGRVIPPVEEWEGALMGALQWNAGLLRDLLGGSTSLLLELFLMAVSAYYFFLDGPRIVAEVGRLIPLEPRHFHSFCEEFQQTARAISSGNLLTAAAQGAVGWFGLWMVGVPHAPVWALAMAIGAFVPVVGTALVWGPISGVLILQGELNAGLALLVYGALIVGSVDNVLRPKLCGARMSLHPLLVFLSIFGGLSVFGMVGLLVGPLIASFFSTAVRIYRRDYLGLEPLPMPTPPAPRVQARAPLGAAGGQPAEVG
ncbi:MAG TPA: AI-2E family transporter [Myxococcaceae bacterium]|nr:AI-2E family transporter [Myxococcaceae bacterium]